MSWDLEHLGRHPNPLSAHYREARVAERLLLTGHSHQAWPDVGRAAQDQAWRDAVTLLDGKWEAAATRAAAVGEGFRRLLDDPAGHYDLGASTHELLVRLLSALPLRERSRILTTDQEFHSARRQFDRLAEAGLEVTRLPGLPAADVGERLAAAVDDRTALVYLSTVYYTNAHRAGGLSALATACRHRGCPLVLDVYHHLNVRVFSLREAGLEDAWVLGGGYKYCQLGEGCAFLRSPPATTLRPVITGWFAEFDGLSALGNGSVDYDPAHRFAGATYDPVSHYRGAAVFDFFAAQGLDAARLERLNRHQMEVLIEGFDALDLDPRLLARDHEPGLDGIGGFLALRGPETPSLHRDLQAAGLHTDARGPWLRLGPAPYLSDRQLADALGILGETVRRRPRS